MKNITSKKLILFVGGVLFIWLFLATFPGCGEDQSQSKGEKLAQQYCGTCHQAPSPDFLTKKSWNYLLTYMGYYMGIVDNSHLEGSATVVANNIKSKEMMLRFSGLIPDQPMVTDEEWEAIRTYFQENAPVDPIPQTLEKNIIDSLPQFALRIPNYQPPAAQVTMVKIDDKTGNILIANNQDQSLNMLNGDLKVEKSYLGNELIVDLIEEDNHQYFLSIGDLEGKYVGLAKGYMILMTGGDWQNLRLYGRILSSLHRPASMELADLNLDGVNELIVCNFGDTKGSLEIYEQKSESKFELSQTLVNLPGIIKTHVQDFDQDGLPDIAVLMGHARENVSLFFNQGNNQFKQKQVVESHSAYGYTYFEVHDFNQDGWMDIMTVNGDSDADPYNTLKNYHGIRIYLNDGKQNFEQAWFYPMYGVHFARAADFDEDGDLDIAATSFFPDFEEEQPEQFVYLENHGNFQFQPYTHPETYDGRWMVMDIGDIDRDGDIDLVLGAAYIPLGMAVSYPEKLAELREKGKAVLVFENLLR
ncbi:MAG: VCBS repeat-containing protein [Bacteroidetes bacterium]|nr:VCBS repeat-containing protein [Bacteroidota bacterium]MCB0844868.1 VCBS repeat-containing protein [Bacteroidota bacterium]